MSFVVPGCQCCHKKITHRIISDAGSMIWSKRDTNSNVGGDVNRSCGIALSKDPGLAWTVTGKTIGSVPSPLVQWDGTGAITDTTTLPESVSAGANGRQVVASDASGNIYIGHYATTSHETIVKLDSSLNEVWRFVSPGHAGSRTAYYSWGIAVKPDDSRIASITYLQKTGYVIQGRIAEHDPSDGSELWSLTYYPTDIAVAGGVETYIPVYTHYDPSGKLWVGFHASITVGGVGSGVWARFDSSGNIDRLVDFSSSATAEELLAFDSAGDVYVFRDSGSGGQVKQYSDTGTLLNTWSSEVTPSSSPAYKGFEIDPNDNLYLFGYHGALLPRLTCYQTDGTKNWHYEETKSSLASAGFWNIYSNDGYVGIAGPLRRA